MSEQELIAKKEAVRDSELEKVYGGDRGMTIYTGTNDKYCKRCGYHTPHYRSTSGKYVCSKCGQGR